MISLEALEDRLTPAVLDIVGGALTFADSDDENNNLTVSVGSGVYTFSDSATLITLGSGAISAGWRGTGTHTVSGPASSVDSIAIAPGGGTNTVNLRSLQDPTTVDGGTGTDAITISSAAPLAAGGLAGIAADVTVNAGSSTSLVVADVAAASRPGTVAITASDITGLGSHAISYSGMFSSLRVLGSASSALAETYTVDSPPASFFRLDTLGGNDDVTVTGNVTGDFYLGAGDDTLTVVSGVTLTGDVFTGSGTNTVNYGEPAFGTITGTVS